MAHRCSLPLPHSHYYHSHSSHFRTFWKKIHSTISQNTEHRTQSLNLAVKSFLRWRPKIIFEDDDDHFVSIQFFLFVVDWHFPEKMKISFRFVFYQTITILSIEMNDWQLTTDCTLWYYTLIWIWWWWRPKCTCQTKRRGKRRKTSWCIVFLMMITIKIIVYRFDSKGF